MGIIEKKIETLQVEVLGEDNHKFEDLITCSETVDKNYRVQGKYVSLKILDANDHTIIGLVETSRNHNIPPKKNHKQKKIDRIGLTTDEGLAYANVFIYEKRRKILMYEVNKSGCFVDHFILYVGRCLRQHNTYKGFEIKLHPVLKSNEYERMLKMRFHKSVEFQIAHPKQIIEDYKHQNDAIFNVCKSGVSIGSTRVSAKFEVQIKDNTLGLSSTPLRELVDKGLELVRGPKGDNIQKIIVTGYESESENNRSIPIDLIADSYKKVIKLNEPRENFDLLEGQRRQEIENLYNQCLPDFDSIFGR